MVRVGSPRIKGYGLTWGRERKGEEVTWSATRRSVERHMLGEMMDRDSRSGGAGASLGFPALHFQVELLALEYKFKLRALSFHACLRFLLRTARHEKSIA